MRARASQSSLSVRAISGAHVVILALDVPERRWRRVTRGLLGFAIQRSELKGRRVVERYWLRGLKRFEETDLGLPPGTPVSLAEHPLQSFQWGDYTAKPDENMLVIRGNARVADIYFGEFMRLFDHIYARFLSKRAQSRDPRERTKNFLKPSDDWVAAHFTDGPKARRRRAFHGSWNA